MFQFSKGGVTGFKFLRAGKVLVDCFQGEGSRNSDNRKAAYARRRGDCDNGILNKGEHKESFNLFLALLFGARYWSWCGNGSGKRLLWGKKLLLYDGHHIKECVVKIQP